jgi:hypothetical protein
MRFLPCTALCTMVVLASCAKKESERGARPADTATAAAPAAAPPTRGPAGLASKLVGTWAARGYNSGSARAMPFTIVYRRADDSVTGTVTFPGAGPKYGVRIVSITESTFVQESDPHQSPTLKKEVVTRTEGRFAGDSISGTFEARPTKGGAPLRGRFTAKRTSPASAP